MANITKIRQAVMTVCKDAPELSYLKRLKYGKTNETNGSIVGKESSDGIMQVEYVVATWKIDGNKINIQFIDLQKKIIKTEIIEMP